MLMCLTILGVCRKVFTITFCIQNLVWKSNLWKMLMQRTMEGTRLCGKPTLPCQRYPKWKRNCVQMTFLITWRMGWVFDNDCILHPMFYVCSNLTEDLRLDWTLVSLETMWGYQWWGTWRSQRGSPAIAWRQVGVSYLEKPSPLEELTRYWPYPSPHSKIGREVLKVLIACEPSLASDCWLLLCRADWCGEHTGVELT